MAIRTGMQTLVDRVRALTGAGTAEYTAGTATYWSDNNLQDVLDSNLFPVRGELLKWEPETIGGGTIAYYDAISRYRDYEEAESGTERWIIRDSIGTEIGTANYTADYRAGRIRFSADQAGSAYYLTAYSYDVFAAAADLWLERMSNFADWYDFSADNQNFSRSQAWEHAQTMSKTMREKAGANTGQGQLFTSTFVRTDLMGRAFNDD